MYNDRALRVRRMLCATALLSAALPWARAAPATDAITGVWLTEEGDSKVEIAASGSGDAATLGGRLVWLKQPTREGKPVQDANNGDPSLRARPIMGIAILSGFSSAAGGGWAGGKVYAPRSGKAYPAELSLGADGRLQIRIKAGIVSKTIYWTR